MSADDALELEAPAPMCADDSTPCHDALGSEPLGEPPADLSSSIDGPAVPIALELEAPAPQVDAEHLDDDEPSALVTSSAPPAELGELALTGAPIEALALAGALLLAAGAALVRAARPSSR